MQLYGPSLLYGMTAALAMQMEPRSLQQGTLLLMGTAAGVGSFSSLVEPFHGWMICSTVIPFICK